MTDPSFLVRTARPGDVDAMLDLWVLSGLKVQRAPAREELERLLRAGSDLVLIAESPDPEAPATGVAVGTVLGTWDGRRGWLQRLATAPEWRGRRIATALVEELEDRLRARGCRKVNLLVERDNASVMPFYEGAGYSRHPLIFMEKQLGKGSRG